MNREIDRAILGACDGLGVHPFWMGTFIRQHTNVALSEGKLSWNNSVYPIYLIQGFWTSVPVHFIIVDRSSVRHGQSACEINLDLVPGTLVSDRDLSDLSPLIRIT